MTLGVDVGGTFTDLAWWDGSRLRVGKTSSTGDQSDGVAVGAADLLDGASTPLLVHGTTVATNALLERRGARLALVTDEGFEDLLEIGRQDRPSLYDTDAVRPEPLVPRDRRHGGLPAAPFDVDAIVVMLLESYRDPGPESELAAEVAAHHPGVDVVASVEVSREFREFERLSTTVLTAYLRPVVERYLAALERRVAGGIAERLLVMQSSGGLVGAASAARQAASILLSGPAGGVVAAAAFGQMLGAETVVSFDMGGTSTDVCRIEGGTPEISYERSVEGYRCRLPSVAIHTVGAGGGSIAWTDPGGGLRVGPRSAGARPGPVAYARGGTEPTVTDADLVVGRIPATARLAGELALDAGAARAALGRIGSRHGLSAEEAAAGVVEIVESHMERAVRRVSVEEGADPAGAMLVAFGGAGGLHAAPLGRRLGMGRVVVPPYAGVLSALGLLLAPPRTDAARTVMMTDPDSASLGAALRSLVEEARDAHADAVGAPPQAVRTTCDVRYRGQSHETPVEVPVDIDPAGLARAFHEAHHRRNGFSRPDAPIEIVTVRATAEGVPALRPSDLPAHVPSGDARVGDQEVQVDGRGVSATVWRRAGMAPGDEVVGPAVVLDGESTTFVPDGDRATLHGSGALVIDGA